MESHSVKEIIGYMLILTKREKNSIFEMVKSAGLNPSTFRWSITQSRFVQKFRESAYLAAQGYEPDDAETLFLADTDFSFTFERNDDGEFYSFCNPHIEVGHGIKATALEGLFGAFKQWLEVVKYEVEEPDFWQSLDSNLEITKSPSSYESKETFDASELLLINQKLVEIENHILKTNSLSVEQKALVNQTFIYLKDRAAESTKLDWKNIFAGAVVSLLLSLAVENAKEIMTFCNNSLSSIVHLLH